MLNLLYESLPDTINIDGKNFRINTDYTYWLELSDALTQEDVDNKYLENIIINLFVDDIPEDFTKAYSSLKWFLKANVNENQGSNNKIDNAKTTRVLDYTIDAVYIISAFRQYYHIDLFEINLHWWQFKTLLMGLDNQSEIKQRIYYRSVNLGSIKDKNERKRIARIKSSLRLKTRELNDEEIAGIF